MAARKKGSRRAAPTTAERRFTVLLEHIEAQNRATIEAVHASEGRLRRDFGLRFDSLEARVAALETAVWLNSERLDQHSKVLEQHSSTLAQHSRTLEEHSSTLAQHSRTLEEHSSTLAQHSRILGEHSRLHESHSQQLIAIRATLERIEAKLASADEEKSLESRVARLEQEVFR